MCFSYGFTVLISNHRGLANDSFFFSPPNFSVGWFLLLCYFYYGKFQTSPYSLLLFPFVPLCLLEDPRRCPFIHECLHVCQTSCKSSSLGGLHPLPHLRHRSAQPDPAMEPVFLRITEDVIQRPFHNLILSFRHCSMETAEPGTVRYGG